MRSLDEARGILEREVQPLPPRRVPLEEALDCRLAASPRSDVNLPPGDVAAMDGYAVRHSDLALGRPLEIAFEVAAGTTPKTLPAGAAARIFTGALLPAGADSVVPQEQAALGAGGEVLLPPAAPGSHVRFRGEVVAVGDELAAIGDLVTPQMVAVLAAAGAANLEVVPRPATAAVVTGDELVGPGQTPGAGQIRDANGPLLAALVANAGLSKPARLRASDSRASLLETLALALDVAELVLTTGGVSVGTYDLVPAVVNELGGEVLVHHVRIKPGKPILVARFGHRWLVGLPGNPVSALVGWRMFGWPLARALAGDVGAFSEVPVNARLEEPAPAVTERTELRPSVVSSNGSPWVRVLSWKGSHDVVALAPANALARLEPGPTLGAGATVPCYPLAVSPRERGAPW